MVKIQVSQGKAETTVNTNNVWDRIVALENGVTVPTSAALNLKADQTALDATNANVTANATLLAELATLQGLKGDGTDSTSSLQTALNNLATISNKIVFPKKTTWNLTATLNIPSNVSIDGNGAIFYLPQGTPFQGLKFSNCTGTKLSNVSVIEQNHNYTGVSHAITVMNSSSNIVIENVTSIGGFYGINISSTTDAYCQNIKVNNCIISYAAHYGLNCEYIDKMTVNQLLSTYNYEDGIKIGKTVKNLRIYGGHSSYNGQIQAVDPNGNGNGIDLYAGGEYFLLDGLTCEFNGGSGIYVKSGLLVGTTGYEYIRDGMIIGCISRSNTSDGLDFAMTSDSISTTPVPSKMQVIGGIFNDNVRYGIHVKGRYINISNTETCFNQSNGINIASGYFINISNCNVLKNGTGTGTAYGIAINAGAEIKINGGFINGSYSDDTPDNIETGLTIYHLYAINVVADACDSISIQNVTYKNWTGSSVPVNVSNFASNSSKFIEVHYGQIATSSCCGSIGSSLILNGVRYIKTTDLSTTSGWERIRQVKKGLFQFNGDGTTKVFQIAHGFPTVPQYAIATAGHTDVGSIPFYVTTNTTNITINLNTAPITGTNNVRYYVYAEVN